MGRHETDTVCRAEHLIEDLYNLIEKQTAMATCGDLFGVEALMFDTENLIQKIAELRVTDSASSAEKKNKLENMYKKLSLIIASGKDETLKELVKARKNKTVFKAYKGNIK